jgi:hypothetical protein
VGAVMSGSGDDGEIVFDPPIPNWNVIALPGSPFAEAIAWRNVQNDGVQAPAVSCVEFTT